MAPSRKSRSAYKRFSNLNEVSPDKDAGSSKSGRPRKKKLSDMLGPQWSHEELERFYEAYRKHGKDWRRVAAVLRNRSVEMVEALYNMNRAYLSLPEGMASVVGLKAMMTDHYNVLEGTESDRESTDAAEVRKPQKRKRAKVQVTAPREDLLHFSNDLSNDGCLSLLKRRRTDGGQPRAVGKRTPRFPVSSLYRRDGRENFVSMNKRVGKSESDANDDDVAHEAALALAVASNRGGSPQVSRSLFNRTDWMKASPMQSWERMNSQSGAIKCGDASLDEELIEGSIGSAGTENGDARDMRSLKDIEGVGTVEVHKKGKKIYRKKEKVEKQEKEFEDGGEACSGTEEGDNANVSKRKVDIGALNVKKDKSTRQGQRKRSKKLFFGDENAALSALQTLADLSLMMPASAMDSESSIQLKEEKSSFNIDDKTGVPEATSTTHQRGSPSGSKDKIFHATSGSEAKKSKPGRRSNPDAFSQVNEKLKPTNKTVRRKSKPVVSKLPNDEVHSSPHLDENVKSEAAGEEGNKSVIKGKRSIQVSSIARNLKTLKLSESYSDADKKGRETGSVVSTAQVPAPAQFDLAARHRSRRKKNLPKIWSSEETSGPDTMSRKLLDTQATFVQDKLSCWLSSALARRWCIFEWFYSAIDYPWFAKREFVEYLNHVGLGHIPRLTRVEWSVIRSSLGKPRRFSENFLSEERKKLEQYRESVRKHYAELRTGARDGLPADLARPLSVGQRVIALHPKTRELHDGSVLTVDHDKCRIQFDRPDIGVEFVMDVDCMPVSPVDNMPEALRRHNVFAEKFSTVSKEPQMNGNINFGGSLVYGVSGHTAQSPMNSLMKQGKDITRAISQAKGAAISGIGAQHLVYSQSLPTAHIQAREADIQALSNLTRALDKQEALLMELRNLNNDVLQHQNDGDGSLKDSDSFKKHYATVLVQLKEAGGQASSALVHLRERNTYTGNPLPPWLKTQVNSGTPIGLSGSVDKYLLSQESGCNVPEIVDGSRLKAQAMVDTAIKAISSAKEGEEAFMRIAEAFDSINDQHLTSDPRLLAAMSPEKANGAFHQSSQSNDSMADPNHSLGRPSGDYDKETQIPAELITSCVATLLMIQTCTERHYPPADVARILDSAVSSLHPCCPENLPIYREIQMSMGRLKTQILALVPTQI
ncbi:protein ALWAYS EARLY 2-like isoform X1 [Punica granatum]|uniref:Protein ALWAYS EARLY 2-like isoform X1 n=1 Tax=Punica granatum TaxID=22663 RepID=A0A6P8E820_PUNGR|nr:protein ALWAYS EARLY 2-like isoform X1 [Punica granatum]XP_031402662.1 protein ALWAYS EARLY 2-like isoform X1 [Punica granatum]XP_031402669.1 protein ALWAYS EARLY 2-like isoform X1 [Punica granatum]